MRVLVRSDALGGVCGAFDIDTADTPTRSLLKQAVLDTPSADFLEGDSSFELQSQHGLVTDETACLLCDGDTLQIVCSAKAQALATLTELGRPLAEMGFMRSVTQGDTEACELYLRAGFSANQGSSSLGTTVLMLAARNGRADVVRILIAAGADVNATTFGGFTPLTHAARYGDEGIVGQLLDAGAIIEPEDRRDITHPLTVAAQGAHTDVADLLLSAGQPCTGQVRAALSAAASAGEQPLVDLLLQAGAVPDLPLVREAHPSIIFPPHTT